MRESKIRNYQPEFRSPLYPWVQIAGIIGFVFLIFEMGAIPLLFVGCFIIIGFVWYQIYARDKIWREYSLLHIVERITGMKSTGYLVDEELREILIERDNIDEERFEQIIKKSKIVNLDKYLLPDEFARLIAYKLAKKLDIDEKKLYQLLKKKETDSSIITHPGVAIFSHVIKGRDKFDILWVRSKKGLLISDGIEPIYSFIMIVASEDQRSFFLHSLMWIVQIAEETDFEEKWINAKDDKELKELILSSWKKRKKY
jgi:mannitol/fructose-specific phosphotransferase system IIA component (Ntr-type)